MAAAVEVALGLQTVTGCIWILLTMHWKGEQRCVLQLWWQQKLLLRLLQQPAATTVAAAAAV